MDLDYPSQKKHDISREVNRMDRRYGSIILSNPQIQLPKKKIPSWIKTKILSNIKNDQHANLLHFMEQQAINIRDQVEQKHLCWNILHLCAKLNAQKCVENLLRHTYQQQPKNYSEVVNSKTPQGDTPIMIACQYSSIDTIKSLLEFGGVDIYISNIKKIMPYQIAFSQNNEQALRLLMKYEVKIKQANILNIPQLTKRVQKQRQSFCPYFTNYLLICFGIKKIKAHQIQDSKQTETDRKMVNAIKLQNSTKSIGMLDISWLEPESVYLKKISLFSTLSSPFAIKQGNIIVSHLLIMFQWLAYYPQLLKNVIFKTQNKFEVHLFTNQQKKIIYVDNFFPFFSQSQQPLFLSLNDQLWPMILQKALTQHYNGYFEPGKVALQNILETITGNIAFKIYTKNLSIEKTLKQFNSLLANLQSQNCMHILKPSSICPLKTEQGRIQCFTILKRIEERYLINCPFTCDQGRRRQLKQTRQMKMHKIHYINPNTMSIWIDQQEFLEFFQQIIFCHTSTPMKFRLRQQIKLPLPSQAGVYRFYLHLKVPKNKKNTLGHSPCQVQKQIGQLVIELKIGSSFNSSNHSQITADKNNKNNIDGQDFIPNGTKSVAFDKCIGWSMNNNYGLKKIMHIQKIDCQVLGTLTIPLQQTHNQILLECLVDRKFWNQQNINQQIDTLIVHAKSDAKIQLQPMDCFIGDLQFIQCCKNYFNNHYKDFDAPIVQIIGDYALILVPSAEKCHVSLQKPIDEDDIIQGSLGQNGHRLDLLGFGQIQYAILSGTDMLSQEKIKIFTAIDTQTAQSLIQE